MKNLILIFLLLCSIHFWRFAFIPQEIYILSNTLSLLIMGFSFLKVVQKNGLQFKYAIILFFIGLFINLLSAYINKVQSPLDTFIAFGIFYFILFYFFLHEFQINRKALENIVIIFALLYSVFHIFQVFSFPNVIFDTGLREDRGTIRFRIEGSGFLFLAYFLLLNRFLLNRQLINLFLLLAFFVIILTMGYRTLSFVVLFLSGLMYIKLVRFSFKDFAILILLVLLFIGLFQIPWISNILEGMITTSNNELKQSDENIRLAELYYFFNVFPENNSIYILGAGFPGTKGDYSLYMQHLQMNLGLYWVDLGLIGFYIILGPIALIGILWYTIKAIFIKLTPDMLFLNFFFAYLLLASITTMEIFREGIFAVEAIGLYLIDASVKKLPKM